MDLPIDLWNFVVYRLKFDLDLYKNCFVVNKSLYCVVKQLYDKIQKFFRIKTFRTNSIVSDKYNIIDYDRVNDNIFQYQHIQLGDLIIIHKNELLKKRNYVFDFDHIGYHKTCHFITINKSFQFFYKFY